MTGRRTFAALDPTAPDGICLDAEGAVWVADPPAREVVRVREGGEVTDRVSTGDRPAFACALGGDDGRTLFVCTGRVMVTPEQSRAALGGAIWQARVEVPG